MLGQPSQQKRHVLPSPSGVGYNSADFTCQGSYFKIKCNFLPTLRNIPRWVQRRHRISQPGQPAPSNRRPGAQLRWLDRQTPKCAAACQPSAVCLIWGNKPVSHPVGRNDNRRPLKPSTAETMMCMWGPHHPSDSFDLFTVCASHRWLRCMYMKGIPRWLDDDLNSLLRRGMFLCLLNKLLPVLKANLKNISGAAQLRR